MFITIYHVSYHYNIIIYHFVCLHYLLLYHYISLYTIIPLLITNHYLPLNIIKSITIYYHIPLFIIEKIHYITSTIPLFIPLYNYIIIMGHPQDILPDVRDPGAGDVLFFSEATVHGAMAWTAEHERWAQPGRDSETVEATVMNGFLMVLQGVVSIS